MFILFMTDINQNSYSTLAGCLSQAQQQGLTEVDIALFSQGGDIAQAIFIHNLMASMDIEFTTYAMSNVDSAALLVYLAGRKRYAAESARFLMHSAGWDTRNNNIRVNEPFAQQQRAALAKDNERWISIVQSRTDAKPKHTKEWTKTDVVYSAQEAQSLGFVHELGLPKLPIGRQIVPIAVRA